MSALLNKSTLFNSVISAEQRRYDIDWLRNLAFILLIFYHIGMFYVTDWGWHVKSAYQSEFLQNIMLLVNQWRMPLIFVISGMALALVEPKINRLNLLKTRFLRIFVPLVIGMYLIVPPQLYFQLIQNNGYSGSYFDFLSFYVDLNTQQYPQYQHGGAGLLTWNHLWYLAYLWHYTLIYCLVKPLLVKIDWANLIKQPSSFLIVLIPTCLLVVYGHILEPLFPKTHALIDDWYNHAISFTAFSFGYLLAKLPNVWQKIIAKRQLWIILAVISYAIMVIRFNRILGFDVDYNQASLLTQIFIQTIWRVNTVFGVLAVIGFAGAYLNKNSPLLSYMNQAVLPWYILHQSIIIILGSLLSQYSLGGFVEPALVTLLTFVLCWLGYELIKRHNITRFMFGMKLNRAKTGLQEIPLNSTN